MGFDPFNLLLSAIVYLTYGSICIVAIIFTFFLDTYIKIDDALKLNIIASRVLTPLEINIDFFDQWAFRHNKILGVTLIALSIIDLKLFLDIIYRL